MDTNLSKQFSFLINENTESKLEKVIEQILASDIIDINEYLSYKNIIQVIIFDIVR